MRSWGDLTSKEKHLFDRKIKARHHLTVEENFEVEGLKLDMICRPLTEAEINRFEHILNSAEAGLLSNPGQNGTPGTSGQGTRRA